MVQVKSYVSSGLLLSVKPLDESSSKSQPQSSYNKHTTSVKSGQAAKKKKDFLTQINTATHLVHSTLLNLISYELRLASVGLMQSAGKFSHHDCSCTTNFPLSNMKQFLESTGSNLGTFCREDKYSFYYHGLDFIGSLNCLSNHDAMRRFNILSEVEIYRNHQYFDTKKNLDTEFKNCILSIPRTSKIENKNISIFEMVNDKRQDLTSFKCKDLSMFIIADNFKSIGFVYKKEIDKHHYDAAENTQAPGYRLIVFVVKVHPISIMIANCLEYYFNMSQKSHKISIHLLKLAFNDNSNSSEALRFQKLIKMRKKCSEYNNLTEDLILDIKLSILQKTAREPNKNKTKLTWKSVPIRNGCFQVTKGQIKLISLSILYSHPVINLKPLQYMMININTPESSQKDPRVKLPAKFDIKLISHKEEVVDKKNHIYRTIIFAKLSPVQNDTARMFEEFIEKNQNASSKQAKVMYSLTSHIFLTQSDRSAYVTIELPLRVLQPGNSLIEEKWYESLNYEIEKCLYIPLFKRFNGFEIIYSIHSSDSSVNSDVENIKSFRIDKALIKSQALDDPHKNSSILGKGMPDNQFVTIDETEQWLELFKEWKKLSSPETGSTESLVIGKLPPKMISLIKGEYFDNRVGIPDTIRMMMWQVIVFSHGDAHSDLIDMKTLSDTYRSLVEISKTHSNYRSVIATDIKRTFPSEAKFIDKGDRDKILEDFLNAYSILDPLVGYFQGFAFIAATLLSVLPSDLAFHTFVSLMNIYNFRQIFVDTKNFTSLSLASYSLNRLIQTYLPRLENRLEEVGVEVKLVSLSWFLTLFTSRFPLNFSIKVLDLYIMFGNPIIYSIALSIMSYGMGIIKDEDDFAAVNDILMNQIPKKLLNEIECVKVLKGAFDFSVKSSQLASFAIEYENLNITEMLDSGYGVGSGKDKSNISFDNINYYASWYSKNCGDIINAKEFYRACLYKIRNINLKLGAGIIEDESINELDDPLPE